MNKIETALQSILVQQERTRGGSGKGSGMTSPPPTILGGHSQPTTAMAVSPCLSQGCSYKEFGACKPPTFNGERDAVVALRWVRKMEVDFDTCSCTEVDKVIYALSVLKSDAIYWWDMETGGQASATARVMSWEDFVKKFKA